MTEQNNGTTASTEGAAGSEQQQQQQPNPAEVKPGAVEAEVKPEAKPAPKEVPPMPTQVPPEGAEYIYDEKSGLWKVRRVADDIARAIERREEGEDEETTPKGDEAAGKAAAEQITVPEILSEGLQRDDASLSTVKEIGAILGESGYQAPQIQRLVDLGAEFFVETEQGHPHLDNREEIEAVLRNRWGSAHDENLKAVYSAVSKLGPKFKAWLETGYGNHLAVLETLSALGRGDFSLGKDAASKEMAKIRASAPMRDSSHRDHTYAVTRYRILANVVARGDDGGAGFEASVTRILGDQVKQASRGEETPAPRAEVKVNAGAEARIAGIREKLGKAKNGSAEWRELRIALNNAYAAAYPGEVER